MGASATVVATAVPDTITLAGRHFPMLDLPADSFRVDVADPLTPLPGVIGRAGSSGGQLVLLGSQADSTDLPSALALSTGQVTRQGLVTDVTVVEAMRAWFVDPSGFPAVDPGLLQLAAGDGRCPTLASAEPLSAKLANTQPAEVAALLRVGYQPNAFRSFDRSFTFNYLPDPQVTDPSFGAMRSNTKAKAPGHLARWP